MSAPVLAVPGSHKWTTYVQYEDEEVGLLALTAKRLLRLLDILLQLAHRIFQGCPGVINLIHNQDVLANQVGHLEGAQIEPLCARDLGARNLFRVTAAQILVEGQTDSLDGDIRLARALEEGSSIGACVRS